MKRFSSKIVIFSLILTLLVGCVVYVLFVKDAHSASDSTMISYDSGTSSSGVSNSGETVCIKDPDIQFFMYHYVRYNDPSDPQQTHDLSVDPRDFAGQMSYVRMLANQKKITLMKGNDFLQSIRTGCFPASRIWIFTDDDGWADAYGNLAPIAEQYQIPFFFGIIGNRIDTKGFVTSAQVQELATNPLFTIASHSMTHENQSIMTETQEQNEMCQSKIKLESIIHIPVLSYIYPSGRMSKNSTRLAQQCGYLVAWSTHFGKNWNKQSPSYYDINRFPVHNPTPITAFQNLLFPHSVSGETQLYVSGEE